MLRITMRAVYWTLGVVLGLIVMAGICIIASVIT
jgi:hypothetical protein